MRLAVVYIVGIFHSVHVCVAGCSLGLMVGTFHSVHLYVVGCSFALVVGVLSVHVYKDGCSLRKTPTYLL